MAEMPVVYTTSLLMKLAGISLRELLPQVYGAIWIPDVVRDEYLAGATPTTPDLANFSWLSVHQIPIDPLLAALAGFGDP
jgi:predicted nucleic acid-binding protein